MKVQTVTDCLKYMRIVESDLAANLPRIVFFATLLWFASAFTQTLLGLYSEGLGELHSYEIK